jgi:hypothetical protein
MLSDMYNRMQSGQVPRQVRQQVRQYMPQLSRMFANRPRPAQGQPMPQPQPGQPPWAQQFGTDMQNWGNQMKTWGQGLGPQVQQWAQSENRNPQGLRDLLATRPQRPQMPRQGQ